MSESVVYRIGDNVLLKKQAEDGQIWIVKWVDRKNHRCRIQRITPDRIFERTIGFKFLILEVDLPRRVKPNEPKVRIKKDQTLIPVFERIIHILKFIHANALTDNAVIRAEVMQSFSLRTVQRHTEALLCDGYLESLTHPYSKAHFVVTAKAIELLNLNSVPVIDKQVA